MSDYNAIVIGGGRNGLTTGTLLQKHGLRVLCLERNSYVGGWGSNASYFPGHINNQGAWLLWISQPDVWQRLGVT